MLKQLHSLEKNQSINETRPGENGELGRGHRQKYRRILSESETSEEYESVNKQVAAKNINRIRARSFLQQYQQEKVKIGPNTSITADQFAHIKWTEPKKATKDLLIAVFGRETISTHCYTGKSSNAFKNKAAKLQLDSLKVSDIISYIKTKFSTEPSVIKKAISEKCADEFKLSKRRHSNCV
ncbi:protein insensitive-like [Onychostoma macrolepis]|uniref:protein insensitive-like n=1 Tax=Onychostoma macrolepis TaxID=369639 RepID=UPI00272C94CC|nr:protein insensitive-like [Onychostoma macrolepis]